MSQEMTSVRLVSDTVMWEDLYYPVLSPVSAAGGTGVRGCVWLHVRVHLETYMCV